MYRDINGKIRQKLGLHIHTDASDGKRSKNESALIYKNAGYDAIAFTDHWVYCGTGEVEGLNIISGAEYNIGERSTEIGVYHIVALFCEKEPDVKKTDSAQAIIDAVHAARGIAVLAHPSWSLNTPEMIMALEGVDATEIYNAVSERGESFRADSSLIIDMVLPHGRNYPLFATDDTHYYGDIDNCKAYIMVECDNCDHESLKTAILEKKFYATQGPEIHMWREGDVMKVRCSPCEHVYFASNCSWARRATHGKDIVSAEYQIPAEDKFVRAFCIDKDGKYAWTNAVLF